MNVKGVLCACIVVNVGHFCLRSALIQEAPSRVILSTPVDTHSSSCATPALLLHGVGYEYHTFDALERSTNCNPEGFSPITSQGMV